MMETANLTKPGFGRKCWLVNAQQIRKRLEGGFRPFVIRTSDGRDYPVPHPDFIAVGQHGVAVIDPDGYVDRLDPLHIASVRDEEKRE